ncbi:MAG: TetR/AcrR family transcriptional regulator [Actinomycetota bacterium]|nr:TetR/AcrR family transcriptional regulator [Actinomycetota bacterium]
MAEPERHLRADAERNRRKLLDAAAFEFRENGLEVCITRIAERAGVGRGTVFRHFPSKAELVAAIVVQRMQEAADRGRARLEDPDPREALFAFLEETLGSRRLDRALLDGVGETFLGNAQIRAALTEVVLILDALLHRAQERGTLRRDVSALDVLMMIKGVCEATGALRHVDPDIANRQFDLVRAALSAPSSGDPLRGRALTLEDVERAFAVAA